MKLKKLILENFRQFLGKQEILLDVNDNRNVIVIHGENGAGKTTILHAFIWCLYGELNLEHKEHLLNEHKFYNLNNGEVANVSVTLIFEDRHKEYTVKRSSRIKKVVNEQKIVHSNLEVLIDGVLSKKPQDTISNVLHKNLKDYFFFDGERIDKLAQPESSDEVKRGIKNIMGLEILKQAVEHLKDVKRELTKEFKKFNQGSDISPQEKLINKEMELDEVKKELEDYQHYRKNKLDEKKKLDELLLKVTEIEQLESKKIELEKQKIELQKKIDDILYKEKQFISSNSYLAISQNLVNDVLSFLESKRKKGELPSGIREQFIQDLLAKGICICGRELVKGDFHYNELVNMLKKTINKNIEDGFISLNGFLKSQENIKEKFLDELKQYINIRQSLEDNLEDTETNLRETKAQIKEESPATSLEIVEKREEVEASLNDINHRLGRLTEKKESILQEIQQLKNEISKFVAINIQQDIAQKRISLCDKALEILENKYELLTVDVKNKLADKVNEIFGEIMRKDYEAFINDNFELVVQKEVNNQIIPVAKSTGENQIASLAFIGSLVYIAKQWEEENKKEYLTGAGVYPLVMDSPFGTLDPEYRKLTSEYLQKLAPQIILLVSQSQWSNEVKNNLDKYICHEYVLKYYNTSAEKVNRSDKFIEINEELYPLEEISDYEYTEIIRVK